jgi:uncharacterized protein YegJ (DUF2314 family)
MNYTLTNGEEINKAHPDTFYMPPRKARENLPKDTSVKLIFDFDDPDASPERMWVTITEKTEDGYVGVLDNEPYTTDTIKYGDVVKFKPENIIQIG